MAEGKHPKNSQCENRAANRKAQAKAQAKLPKGEQSKRVAASRKKTSTPNPSKKTSGSGEHGSQRGRPRKGDC